MKTLLLSISSALFIIFSPTNIFSSDLKGPVVLVVGTRPEVIKMFPVYNALKESNIHTILCSTGQHAQLADEMFSILKIKPDYELKIMKPGQDLFYITDAVLSKTKELFEKIHPSLVIVQGDTTTAMAAALAAFYLKIPIGHVEAGLRTGNMHGPFPEEMNRRFISVIASYHFTPTQGATDQLIDEGVNKEQIYTTGNTVVDALYAIQEKINSHEIFPTASLVDRIRLEREKGNRILLLTAHRRESFDGGIEHIFSAIKKAIELNPKIFVVYPAHPNPQITKFIAKAELDKVPNILISPPLSYTDLAYVLNAVDGIATDSGGIQEEAASLNKPTLILRNETDRPEAVHAGIAKLVGTDEKAILDGITWMINDPSRNNKGFISPYGDGLAGKKIALIVNKILKNELQIPLNTQNKE